MGSGERFTLHWNDFQTNAKAAFKEFREEGEFFDVTLFADDGRRTRASKVVLSGGSPFFHKILKENPDPQPLIYLTGVGYEHLVYLMDFLYTGEVSIFEEDVYNFLYIAHDDLKVKGLIQEEISGKTNSQLSKSFPTKIPALSPKNLHPHSTMNTSFVAPQCTSSAAFTTSDPHSATSAPHDQPSHTMRSCLNKNDGVDSKFRPSHSTTFITTPHSAAFTTPTPQTGIFTCPSHSFRLQMATSAPPTKPSKTSSHLSNSIPSPTIMEACQLTRAYKVEVGDSKSNVILNEEPTYQRYEQDENEKSTHDWYEGGEENDDNDLVLNGEQKPNEEEIYVEGKDSKSGKINRNKIIRPDKKQYQCLTCHKQFKKLDHFNRHKRVHTGEKPYQCLQCSKTFPYAKSLSNHMKIHTGEKPHKCLTCDKKFAQLSTLNTHKRVHTGEKPYKCLTCHKKFSRSSNLNAHKRVHTGEKKVHCGEKLH